MMLQPLSCCKEALCIVIDPRFSSPVYCQNIQNTVSDRSLRSIPRLRKPLLTPSTLQVNFQETVITHIMYRGVAFIFYGYRHFTQPGYQRAAKNFKEDISKVDLSNKSCLVGLISRQFSYVDRLLVETQASDSPVPNTLLNVVPLSTSFVAMKKSSSFGSSLLCEQLLGDKLPSIQSSPTMKGLRLNCACLTSQDHATSDSLLMTSCNTQEIAPPTTQPLLHRRKIAFYVYFRLPSLYHWKVQEVVSEAVHIFI